MTAMKRDVTVTTNLGADVLLCARMDGKEEMSRPFEYVVDLLTQQEDIELHKLVGQPMTVNLTIAEGKTRYFNGLVSQIAFTGSEGDYHTYRAVVRPWLWTLSRRTDCRVFQDRTVPDIVKEVFRDAGFSDFEEKLSGDYVERGYCVQYRETDLDFVSRLLEEEGIYYFFLHEDGKHTLVLADSINAHAPFDGHADMKFFPPGRTETLEEPHIFDWEVAHEYQSNIVAQTDYDFTEPTKDLATNASIPRDHTRAEFEVYDYPGGYTDAGAGDTIAKIRIEELQAGYERCSGTGNVPGVAVGYLFTLGNHPRGDQNQEYLVLACRHTLSVGSYESKSAGGGDASYECSFTVQPSAQAYRPPRVTPKRGVQGPHTATVVGPDGETVWCDEYGRVKVQFHWDRVGEVDENSSCWVRVSQASAGANWGSMFLPHIGQEVIIDFLEGDPDKPVITGRLYNADNMPPLSLPDYKYKSIIRDAFGNQLIFDGTPGEEHISMYSPSHESLMQLGRSADTQTFSSTKSYTYDKESYHFGYSKSYTRGESFSMYRGLDASIKFGGSGSLTLGLSASVFVGQKLDFSFGGSYSYSAAWSFSHGYSRDFKRVHGSFKRRSKKNILLDSESKIFLTGGKDDNTMIEMSNTALELSFDKAAKHRDISKLDTKSKMAAVTAAVAFGAGAGLSAWGYHFDVDTTDKFSSSGALAGKDAKTSDISGWSAADTGVIAGGVLGMIASAFAIRESDLPDPDHPKPDSSIKLQQDYISLFAGETKEAWVKLTKSNGIVLETKEVIRLDADKGILYNTPKDITVKATKAKFKLIMDHKNLKVLQ